MSGVPVRKALIVDDTPEDRETVRRALLHDSNCRYLFLQARTAEEALDLVGRNTDQIDLAVIDWRLPDSTGLELAERLRNGGPIPPFPIIMITGSTPQNLSREVLESGIQDFFFKSQISPDSFPHIARNAIDRYRLVERLVHSEHDARLARIRAEDASRAKSMFLSSMSHELRTPLTAVLGLTELLMENPTAEDSRHMLEMIRSNGNHLAELLNDILDLAKIEAGTVDVDLIECNPLLLVKELCDLLRFRAQDQGLALVLNFDGPVPSRMRTDPVRLRQILMNLLTNAIKFTDRGEIQVCVDYKVLDTEVLTIEVSDSGVGIETSDLDAIFEPFVQVTTDSRRRNSGAGLGLSISRSLARALGGNLTVKSTLGVGSTFRLRIRANNPQEIGIFDAKTYDAPRASAPSRIKLADRCWVSRKILVAEDTPANQFLIARMLEGTAAQVTFVDNGEGAVAAVEQARDADSPFDIVLMDIQMPRMNGFQATRALRSAGHDLPIIALTAAAMDGDREQCLAAGCTNYLSKPIHRDRLLSMISDALPASA